MNQIENKTPSVPVQMLQKLKLKISNFFHGEQNDNKLIVMISLIIIMLAISGLLINSAISTGANALVNSYNSSYSSVRSNTYDKIYKDYFDKAKRDYHVNNRVAVSIGNLREIADLEVLTVSDVEYIIESSQDNRNGIDSWLEVPGTGQYIIDLKAAEFIVDDQHSHILARIPYPQLTNVVIDYQNVHKLMFNNDAFNESYRLGEELARKQLDTADMLIKKEFASNQHFYLSAQHAAVNAIQCLVKQLNPGVPSLVVDVEFME